MNVLLVTGSRSLDRTEIPVRHFDEIMLPFFEGMHLLVVGDADGPDHWALSTALSQKRRVECWELNGSVYGMGALAHQRRWLTEDVERRYGTKPRPLIRNAEMVLSCATLMRDGHNVVCVGFVDPASKTHGTDHTLGLARRAGIWTARYVWRYEGFVEES
jgi:hypothetical protein